MTWTPGDDVVQVMRTPRRVPRAAPTARSAKPCVA